MYPLDIRKLDDVGIHFNFRHLEDSSFLKPMFPNDRKACCYNDKKAAVLEATEGKGDCEREGDRERKGDCERKARTCVIATKRSS